MRQIEAIRRILVPTDFSLGALRALHNAVELARRFDATITLVHVYDLPPLPPRFVEPQLLRNFLDGVDQQLDEARDAAVTPGGPLIAVERIESHNPAEAIAELVRREGFDLIVMGTRGRSGLERLLMGSVAERVVRLAPCPVLTIGDASTRRAGASAAA